MTRARKSLYGMLALLLFFGSIELVLFGASWLVQEDRTATDRTDESQFTLLCLGDSFTYGQYVERSEGYPAQLQQLIYREYGEHWQVINGGQPGKSPRGLYGPLQWQIDASPPDLVLIMAGFNGPSDRAILEFAERNGGQIDPTSRTLVRLNATLQRFRSFRLLRNGLLRLVERPKTLDDRFVPAGFRQATWRSYQEVNQANLQALVDLAHEHRVDVVLMNYPQAPVPENPVSDIEYYYSIYLRVSHPKVPLSEADYLYPRSRPDEMAINAMTRYTARVNDLPLVDNFRAFVDRDDRDALFIEGDEHPNGAGYGLLARTALRTLEEAGYLKASKRRE